MNISRYEPFDRICKLINDLPKHDFGRKDILQLICISIGVPAQETGLPITLDRKIGQIFWDYEASQLRDRLTALLDRMDVQPDFLVNGILCAIDNYLVGFTDPEQIRRAIDHHRRIIDKVQAEKMLPVEGRSQKIDDQSLDHLRELSEAAIKRGGSGEYRRRGHARIGCAAGRGTLSRRVLGSLLGVKSQISSIIAPRSRPFDTPNPQIRLKIRRPARPGALVQEIP